MNKNLLPMGSVVTLEGAEKTLMIVGMLVENEETKKVYDYIAVPFPEGFIDSETMFLFSHEDIAQVHYVGYVNAASQAYRALVDAQLEREMGEQ